MKFIYALMRDNQVDQSIIVLNDVVCNNKGRASGNGKIPAENQNETSCADQIIFGLGFTSFY